MVWDLGVLLVSAAALAAFVAVFHYSGVYARARNAVDVAHRALSVIADQTLDDEEKQRLIQRGALSLLAQFSLILASVALVFLAPTLIIFLGEIFGVAPFISVSRFLIRWEFIAGSTAIALVVFWFVRRP